MRSMVEHVWLHHIAYKLCPKGVLTSKIVLWKRFFYKLQILDKLALSDKILAYVKDRG
jgi:hypothetical protein